MAWRGLYLILAVAFGVEVRSQEAAQTAAPEYSQAEVTLWMTDQLRMIDAPVKLTYAFTKNGSYEPGFEDTVELDIVEAKADGTKHARVKFFTGERHQFVPDHENTSVNPVLGIFLQGDVYEMDRLTDGHWRYFQSRLKRAFSESARVGAVTVEFEGRLVEASRIEVQPYLDDPHATELRDFLGKTYTFTVSDRIPGYLYEVHTIVPGRASGDAPPGEPIIEERLRLIAVSPR
jgi:hypothetical protein